MANKNTERVWEVTRSMRLKNAILNGFKDALNSAMKPRGFWNSKPDGDLVKLLVREEARAAEELWDDVFATYPETRGMRLRISDQDLREYLPDVTGK